MAGPGRPRSERPTGLPLQLACVSLYYGFLVLVALGLNSGLPGTELHLQPLLELASSRLSLLSVGPFQSLTVPCCPLCQSTGSPALGAWVIPGFPGLPTVTVAPTHTCGVGGASTPVLGGF